MHDHPSPGQEWVGKRSRLYWCDQYVLNQMASAFARYDPDRIADEISATGADIVALYATNQFGIAYYPSHVWPTHPMLHGLDYFGDLLGRFRARGIKVIAYINWLDSKHADWTMVPIGKNEAEITVEQPLVSWAEPGRPNGRVQDLAGGAWQMPCPLSPQREQVVAIAREICENYRPDALHLDMLHSLSPCVCRRCRKALASLPGFGEMTPGTLDTRWNDYIRWWNAEVSGIINDLGKVLRKHHVVAAHNFGLPFWPASNGVSEDWLQGLDVVVSEAFDAFGILDLNATSITVLVQHALGKPAWLLRTSSPMKFAHWPIPEMHWLIHSAACKANGAAAFGPCGVTAYPDTRTPASALASIKTAFDDYMQDNDLTENATPAARVALLLSLDSRQHVPEKPSSALIDKEFYGWARFLIEEHIPFQVVTDHAVASGSFDFSAYDAMILPDAICMSDQAVAAINAAIQQGLGLLATGRTSLRTGSGDERRDFALHNVLGIKRQGETCGSFAVEASPDPEPARGRLQQVQCLGTIRRRALTTDPDGPVAQNDDPMPADMTDDAVLATSAPGRGRTAYLAFDTGRYFDERGLAATAQLMREALDSVLPHRQVRVKAPRSLEITVWRQEAQGRLVMHLANRTVPWSLPAASRQITEVIPVHDIEIRLPVKKQPLRVDFRHTNGTVQSGGQELVIRLDKVATYAAVILEEPNSKAAI